LPDLKDDYLRDALEAFIYKASRGIHFYREMKT